MVSDMHVAVSAVGMLVRLNEGMYVFESIGRMRGGYDCEFECMYACT